MQKRKKQPPTYDKTAWIEKKIKEKHALRAKDEEFQQKVHDQAIQLLRERVAIFGEDWHINCAVQIPDAIKELVDRGGPGALVSLFSNWKTNNSVKCS